MGGIYERASERRVAILVNLGRRVQYNGIWLPGTHKSIDGDPSDSKGPIN
jgi:hypothetical protein